MAGTDRGATSSRPTKFATPEGGHPVSAELIAEHASIQPGGATRVGVHFELEEGWHIYAHDPGDAGLPTTVIWKPLEGQRYGPLQWPPHQEFVDPGDIRTRGYSGSVVLSSTLTISPRAVSSPPGAAQGIRARAEWLACKEICLPGSADLELGLPVSIAPPALSAHAELFDHVTE